MRAGDLPKSAYGVASRALRRDWDRLAVVDFREVEAGRLAAKYGLRGFDAIHLSSAMAIASAPAGPDVLFSSFDAALNRAAAGERLQVHTVPVNCPYCKIPSMDAVASGEVEVDRCRTCGAAWFDPGEIRELTQGRLPAEEEPSPGPIPPLRRRRRRAPPCGSPGARPGAFPARGAARRCVPSTSSSRGSRSSGAAGAAGCSSPAAP